MTYEEKNKIAELYSLGYRYKKISTILNISESTVKSHICRNFKNADVIDFTCINQLCWNCKKPIVKTPHKKAKKFCSDKCRNTWWNSHLHLITHKTIYHHTCKFCGINFDNYQKNAQYCSRRCYADARRKENIHE